MNAGPKPFFLQALDALKQGDRRGGAALLARELAEGNTSAKNLPSVSQLAAHIGEVELAIEALKRAVVPGSIDSLLAYWAAMATHGRAAQAQAEAQKQSVSVREHPAVLHFRGTVATQLGRFEEAQELFRRALAKAPAAMHTWLALAMVKKFTAGDPDLAAMERLERQAAAASAEARATLYYALGKAREDCGHTDQAFDAFARGAALRRQARPYDVQGFVAAAQKAVEQFTPDNLARLVPSQFGELRSLFVTGLPRSGTTLTEQILVSHSKVADGAELNLFATALTPTLGAGFDKAIAYQQRTESADPWGDIGRDYGQLVDQRFNSPGQQVVDKSLGQSLLVGLMLHALPEARIAWLRRSPDDVALSCFRTYFATGLPWTCSLADIADYMRAEDRLFEHWRAMFPERILVVPYEDLAASPAEWAERLQRHFGLDVEAALEQRPRTDRAVTTASVGQVAQPISTERIGRAAAFERHLKPFRDRYYR